MNKKPAKIVIFHDPEYKTATWGIAQSLRTIFHESVDLEVVDAEGINHPGIWDPEQVALVIVPPIIGEKCLYNELFSDKLYRKEKHFIEQGGVSLRICAGGWHTMESFSYASPNTEEVIEKISTTPHFSGSAYGPLHRDPHDPESNTSPLIVTPVQWKVDDELITFGACYDYGPIFVPKDSDVKIITEYCIGAEHKPAVIGKDIGRGLMIASGILPHYGYLEKGWPTSSEKTNQILEKFEPQRQQFLTALYGKIARHAVRRGTLSEESLTLPIREIPKLCALNDP